MATRARKKINQMSNDEARKEHSNLIENGHFQMKRTIQIEKNFPFLKNS